MTKSKEELVTYALLSERTERYSDMLSYMLDLIRLGDGLNEEDRNMLSVACKNTVGPKRSSCRCLAMLEEKHAKDSLKLECVRELREVVIKEMSDICHTLVSLIESNILNKNLPPNDTVFYKKMSADYYRYLAETLYGEERENAAKKAAEIYQSAYDVSVAELKPTHPIRLGVMLNFSVYYYEIRDDVKKAQKIARDALDAAVDRLGEEPECQKDCELILQLLRDNLSLWNSEAAVSSSDEDESTTDKQPL